MKVINLFAGPGAGKSTTAASIFYKMKMMGLNVELITEYAKDMTWERRFNVMSDQIYMFAKQHRRQLRLIDQVDYVVTDSPLLFTLLYTPEDYPTAFTELVMDRWGKFDNNNYFLVREKEYKTVGRSQTEEEARIIDLQTAKMLRNNKVLYTRIPGNELAAAKILDTLGLL